MLGCSGLLLPHGLLLKAVHTRGPGDRPEVALTFDDGPNGRCTEAVLDVLARLGVHATFFVLGRNVDRAADDALLRRMVDEGHVIGLHGYHHEGPLLVSPRTLREELQRAARSVEAALQRAGDDAPRPRPRLFRPPFGFLTGATAEAALGEGFSVVLWTVSVGDWRSSQTAREIVDHILSQVDAGDIIVLHDGFRAHHESRLACIDRVVLPEALELLIPRLRERGLEPVTVPELLRLPVDANPTARP